MRKGEVITLPKKLERIIYGGGNYQDAICEILARIQDSELRFDIELILSEAISNAYVHGNKMDVRKPIIIRCLFCSDAVKFQVQDCGVGFGDVVIPDEIAEEDLLAEKGRGLFLIKCFSDKVYMRENILFVTKKLVSKNDK